MRVFDKFTSMALAITIASSVHAGRTLVNEADIDASPTEVWNAWTTEDGFTSWAVAKAKIDLRVGGDMIISYAAAGTLDDDSTIINRILAFEPERMLSVQNVRAPKAFKNAELFQDTWTVMYLEPLGPIPGPGAVRTHVRIVGMGYGDGPQWDEIYNKFKVGNAYTLKKLQEKFAPPTSEPNDAADAKTESSEPAIDANNVIASDSETFISDPQAVMAVLNRLVGGEWIHDGQTPDGKVFLVRNILERGPDGVSIVGKGWLGNAEGMSPHQSTQIFRQAPDPRPRNGSSADATQRVVFHAIDEHSSVSEGDIVLVDAQTVQWNWNLQALDGQHATFRVRMKFANNDHYQFTLAMQGDNGQWTQMVDAAFERVSEVPEKFRKLKPTK